MCNPLWPIASEFLKKLSDLEFEDYFSLIVECEAYECAVIAAGLIEFLSSSKSINGNLKSIIEAILEAFGKPDMFNYQLMLIAFHEEVQTVFKTYIRVNYSEWRIGSP